MRAVYEDGVWKFYGPAAAVGKCAGEMQLIVDHEAAVEAAVREVEAAEGPDAGNDAAR